jgi:hypothetical protein
MLITQTVCLRAVIVLAQKILHYALMGHVELVVIALTRMIIVVMLIMMEFVTLIVEMA